MVLADHQPESPPEMVPAAAPFDPTPFGLERAPKFGVSDLNQLIPSPRLDYILGNSSIPPPGWNILPPPIPADPPAAVVQDPEIIALIHEVGWLMPTVEFLGGFLPQFLYEKKLKKNDVSRDRRRVFLRGGQRKIMGFLRAEEAAAVNGDGNGLTVVGVDGDENVYENLVLKRWNYEKVIVIKSDWINVVERNGAKENDVMNIWGFREKSGRPWLAFKFN